MKILLVALVFLCASFAWAGPPASKNKTYTYSDIDDTTTLDPGGGLYGWGWCGAVDCAGGANASTPNPVQWGVSPSVDGNGSAQFMITGPQYSDALWWYKTGPNSQVSNFQFDYWIWVDPSANSYAQAIEAEPFQYIGGRKYTFGTQCNYSGGYNSGVWDVWNQRDFTWVSTGISCPGFVTGDWYHITWRYHRTRDTWMHYDSVMVEHYDSDLNLVDKTGNRVNMAEPSGPLPAGWDDNMGVQFQLDLNTLGGGDSASYSVLVDKVRLVAW